MLRKIIENIEGLNSIGAEEAKMIKELEPYMHVMHVYADPANHDHLPKQMRGLLVLGYITMIKSEINKSMNCNSQFKNRTRN